MTEAADVRKGPARYDGSNIITGIAAGIVSINGDTTHAQLLTGDPQIVITDLGAGSHNIGFNTVRGFLSNANVPVPDGVRTTLLQGSAPGPGNWIVIGDCNSTGAPAAAINASWRLLVNLAGFAWTSARTDAFNPATYHENFGATLTTIAFGLNGTENIIFEMYQESGLLLDLSCHLTFARFGTNF